MILDGKNWLVEYEGRTDGVSICVFAGVVNSTLTHDDHVECYHEVSDGWVDQDGNPVSQEDAAAMSEIVVNVHHNHLPDLPLVFPEHVYEPTAEEVAAAVNAPYVSLAPLES